MPQVLIASLPRSSNHLVRFIVEYVTGRETLGIRDNPRDLPLCNGVFPAAPDVLKHVSGPAIGRKVHFAEQLEAELAQKRVTHLIVIHRREIEAVFSQMVKTPRFDELQASHGVGKIFLLWKFSKSCWRYTRKCRRFYQTVAQVSIPTTFICYEKLISDAATDYLPQLQKLADSLDGAVDATRMHHLMDEFKYFRELSAGRIGGDWGGINSGFQKRYYHKLGLRSVRLIIAPNCWRIWLEKILAMWAHR
jgi:hypothetical protein